MKGRLVVTGVERVQAPRIWERYALRRAMIAQDRKGDANEMWLWHGTQSLNLVLRHGFDPRVCSMRGMFGAGVYFAENSTKSVRYALGQNNNNKPPGPGAKGTLVLCRVALGTQMVKRLPQPGLRRPPARHDSAEHFSRLKALRCTAMAWIFFFIVLLCY